MLIFKLLHILAMFSAVTLLIGEALLLGRVVWRRDVGGLAAVLRLLRGRTITFAGASLFLIGIGFGFLAAITGPFDLLDGWLIAAYVLVVALFAVNGTPWVQGLADVGAQAVDAEAGRRSRDDVIQAMNKLRTGFLLIVAINVFLVIALIADMVLKPF